MDITSKFYSNHTSVTFLEKLRESLAKCDRFMFSISFIKMAGVRTFSNELEEALARGVSGSLITSTYQNFTDVASLKYFLKLQQLYPNFSVKLDYHSQGKRGFHSKGYIFENPNDYEVIIGSSNITKAALETNVEWNISVISKIETYVEPILNEFYELWNKAEALTPELVDHYASYLEFALERWDMDFNPSGTSISPNSMQRKALKELQRYRDLDVKRALIIAATGSGKTYLAAFDVKSVMPKRMLFVVHRDAIIGEALRTFQNVIGDQVTYGKLVGEFNQTEQDYIFGSNIKVKNQLGYYSKDAFDYIIIDEAHHATASSYKEIIEYFEPQFLLGLTATPERMDGEDVFSLFERNVPYELRLRDALKNDLVAPFHYFGIRDNLVDYSFEENRDALKQLASPERAIFIQQKIEEVGFDGKKLKAIGFCKDVNHAKKISESMNDLVYNTIALEARSDYNTRMQAFKNLQNDHHGLQIVFAVDILNEGVDLPEINMVLFLRPTESSTIFIQQLGRGLRKHPDKQYLTVLDFIGNNYKRSVQIALALGTLSEDTYTDKPYLMESVRNDFRNLDLPIEIYIDEFSKQEILTRIEQTNFNSKKFLDQDYLNFRNFLGKGEPPKHVDFLEVDSAPDLIKYIKLHGSYNAYLSTVEKDQNLFIYTSTEQEVLKYISGFLPIIRPFEFLIIRQIIQGVFNLVEIASNVELELEGFDRQHFNHAIENLQNHLYSDKEQKDKTQFFKIEGVNFLPTFSLSDLSFKEEINDLLEYGLRRFLNEFIDFNPSTPIKIYGHYTRQQFLLATLSHTLTFREGIRYFNNQLYIFVDLHKDEDKAEHLKYEDEFISKNILKWESSTSTTLSNKKGLDLINQKVVHIFVRKIKKEDGLTLPYIYIGKGTFTNPRVSKNTKQSLLFDIILDNPIPDYLSFDFNIM